MVVLIWTCAAGLTVKLGRIGIALDEVRTAGKTSEAVHVVVGCITSGNTGRTDVVLSTRRARSNALLRITVRSIYHVESRTRSLADKRLGCSLGEAVRSRSTPRIAQSACFGVRNGTGT